MMAYYGSALSILFILLGLSSAHITKGRTAHGFIGMGITMYHPPCAFACRASISSAQLNCSAVRMVAMDGMSASFSTSPECYATDDFFLQTLAWCISSRCTEVPIWEIERFWLLNIAGTQQNQPNPKEAFEETLLKVSSAPSQIFNSTLGLLDSTQLVDNSDWIVQYQTLVTFESVEDNHEKYGLVVLLSGFVVPIILSFIRFLPFPRAWTARFNAYFHYPSICGPYHSQPLPYIMGNPPTRGQALFIFYLIAINVILSAVGYNSAQPNAWYPDRSKEISTYVTNRLGVLSFANIPLLILYSGRNNVLLWITNWSHSTFMLLHRWVARICVLQAVLHSIIYLQIYTVNNDSGDYSTESKLAYWYWGIVATLAFSLLIPLSLLVFRQRLYEPFLITHIILSIVVIVGCYYHIWYRFERQWGYETWIYIAIAVWGFDRVMRVLRIARNGIQHAKITVLDHEYLRIDIPHTAANGHVYLYFPTLTWRVWENHPFSVAGSILRTHDNHQDLGGRTSQSKDGLVAVTKQPSESDINTEDKGYLAPVKYAAKSSTSTELGNSFFIRTLSGTTSLLRHRRTIPVLMEGSYGQHTDLSAYTTLVCIAGGVGITGVLPAIRHFAGQVKVFWGVRSQALVFAMRDELRGIDVEVTVGSRMDLSKCLAGIAGNFVVIVSGPGSMADDVRGVVSELAKERDVKLVEESFCW